LSISGQPTVFLPGHENTPMKVPIGSTRKSISLVPGHYKYRQRAVGFVNVLANPAPHRLHRIVSNRHVAGPGSPPQHRQFVPHLPVFFAMGRQVGVPTGSH